MLGSVRGLNVLAQTYVPVLLADATIYLCFQFHTLVDLWGSTFQEVGKSQILHISELNTHMVNCICVYKGVQLKYRLQNCGT